MKKKIVFAVGFAIIGYGLYKFFKMKKELNNEHYRVMRNITPEEECYPVVIDKK